MKYRIKAKPKTAIQLIKLLKATKNRNSNKLEVRTKPIVKLQELVLTELMADFFRTIQNIKKDIA